MDVPQNEVLESAGGQSDLDKILDALVNGDILHTSAVAERAGLNVNVTSFLLARLHRRGEVVRYFPRKSNLLNEKLWQSHPDPKK